MRNKNLFYFCFHPSSKYHKLKRCSDREEHLGLLSLGSDTLLKNAKKREIKILQLIIFTQELQSRCVINLRVHVDYRFQENFKGNGKKVMIDLKDY